MQPTRPHRDISWQAVGVVALLVCLWTLVAVIISRGTRAAQAELAHESEALATIIAEQAEKTFIAADYLISFAAEEFSTPQPVDRLAERHRAGKLRLDNLVLLSIVDAQGRLVQTNKGPSTPPIDLSDREHIRVHLDGQPAKAGLFIGKPVRGRASGHWSIQLTRPIAAADGKVAGVVVGSLNPQYFERFWQSSKLPGDVGIELVGTDGVVRAINRDIDNALGSGLARPDLLARIAGQAAGSVRIGEGADAAVVHFKRVGDLPLYLALSVPADLPGRSFEPLRNQYLALAAIASLIVLAFASVLMRRTRQLVAERHEALVARQRLQDAVEAIPEGFALFDAEDRLVVFNEAYRRVYDVSSDLVRSGVTFEALIREGAKRGQYAAATGRIDEWVAERMRAHRSPDGPFEQLIGDGRWLRIEERKTADGGIVGIRADISAIKQRELELARKTAMLTMTFENMSEGLSVVGASGNLIAHNRLFADLLDLPPSIVHSDIPFAELLALYANSGDRWNANGDAEAAYSASVAGPGVPVLWRREDGRQIELRSARSQDGSVVTIYDDVTERLKSAEQLRSSEAQKSAMISSALDAIIVIDELGEIVEFNPAAERIFGWSAQEIVGRSVAETLIPPVGRARLLADMAMMRRGRRPRMLGKRIEVEALRRDGERFPAELTVTAIKVGRRCLYSAYLRDISVSKRLELERRTAKEAAEAANRAKSEFLAMVSHDVRTPLNAIVGFGGLLRTTPLDAEQKRFSEGIEDAANRLLKLINEILDFSRVDAGRLAFDVAPFETQRLVDGATDMAKALLSSKPVEITAQIAPAVPAVLEGDEARIAQILHNLIGNSAKFTQQGAIALKIDAIPVNDKRVHLVIDVSDTGPGIPADRQARLFQPFEQGGRDVADRYGGSGLGLVISRKLAELMGGSVDLISSTDAGTTFRAVVALDKGAADVIASSPTQDVLLPTTGRPLQILVAEDTPANQAVLRAMLERLGHWVQIVGNGAEAVELVAQRRFDLVLMDIQMPVMDGLAATRSIRALPQPSGATTIVALTAQARDQDIREAGRAGVTHYLVKPITFERLQKLLADCAGTEPLTEPLTGQPTGRPPVEGSLLPGEGPLAKPARDVPSQEGAPQEGAPEDGAAPHEARADVDQASLDNLRASVGDDLFETLVDCFLGDASQLLRELSRSLERTDAKTMRATAHRLSGLFSQFGLIGPHLAAQGVETAPDESVAAKGRDLVRTAGRAMDTFKSRMAKQA